MHGYRTQAAAAAPDSLFAFRPVAEVRSFGETLDHVAASERGYCEMALGERPRGGGAGTGARTKAEVLAALLAGKEVCERAYGQTDEEGGRPAFGGGRATRLQALIWRTRCTTTSTIETSSPTSGCAAKGVCANAHAR